MNIKKLFIKSIFFSLLTSSILLLISIITSLPSSYSHIDKPNVQEWIDENKNIKIQFDYEPDKPIIDTFTELLFSVQDLETGEHIKNFDARVVVTNGIRLFKFENITVADGDFSVKYLFPDDGTHQVLARINTNNSISLASFSVFVPHQAPPSMLNPFPKTVEGDYTTEQMITIVLAVLIPLIAVISLVMVIKKNKPKTH
ncbi:MAG TPA: hypothetical protein VFV86_05450 [Nitrososphaeraceae archaeon]|nr:hypothetical protein [Nitrososphaeraceae archaeon]